MQNRHLGFEPVSTTLAAKAALTSIAKAAVMKKFSSSIASIFGDSKDDKIRKAQAAGALERALDGDVGAVAYLLARSGIRPDKSIAAVAPSSGRFVFRKALREYYTAIDTMPASDIAKEIWASPGDIPASLRDGITQSTTTGGLNPTSPASGEVLRAGMPSWALLALAGAVGVSLLQSKSRRTRR